MNRVLAWIVGTILVTILIGSFGGACFYQGKLTERLAWTQAQARDTQAAIVAKAKVDVRRAVATQESSDDIKGRLVDALAAAANRPPRLCGPAPASHDLPGAAPATAGADDAGQADELATERADNAACAEGITKAQGWQDWWRASGAPAQ